MWFWCFLLLLSFGADAVEEDGGGFVVAAFPAGKFGFSWDKFAAEGFGGDGGRRFEDRGVLVRPLAIFSADVHSSLAIQCWNDSSGTS